jgi:hypothetical protein
MCIGAGLPHMGLACCREMLPVLQASLAEVVFRGTPGDTPLLFVGREHPHFWREDDI